MSDNIHISENGLREFARLISEPARVAVITHLNPDGDAIGCCLGMTRYLGLLGHSCTVIVPSEIPSTLAFMGKPGDCPAIDASRENGRAAAAILGSELVICMDFNSIGRAPGVGDAFRRATCPKVLVDHHLSPAVDEFSLVFSQTDVSSASELTFWLLKALHRTGLPAYTAEIMEALMTGMTTDTNNFGNSVFPSTLEMASECIAAGVDRDALLSHIYNEYREERYRLLGYVLSEKLHITPAGAAYVVLSASELERFGILEGETEAFVNIPLGIGRVRMSLFLKEKDGIFRVSIRSKRGISASRLARESFSGGGHEMAAGGRLEIGKTVACAADAERYIVEVTDKFLAEENE